jgi:hypothetical protein
MIVKRVNNFKWSVRGQETIPSGQISLHRNSATRKCRKIKMTDAEYQTAAANFTQKDSVKKVLVVN